MPKRSRKKKADQDRKPLALTDGVVHNSGPTVQADTDAEKNPAAVALGRLGGLKGGKARAAKMTKAQRSESARKAAKARWEGKS
jgi:hypothetical protein